MNHACILYKDNYGYTGMLIKVYLIDYVYGMNILW